MTEIVNLLLSYADLDVYKRQVLFVTGSEGMCGAAYLSASAALRAGAGMVKIQTVEANRIPLQILLPEAMVCSRFDQESNEQLLSWCDVIVIGPGPVSYTHLWASFGN